MSLIREKEKFSRLLVLSLYIIFFTSLFFSLRAISSISIALLFLAGIFTMHDTKASPYKRSLLLFTGACLLVFLLQFLPLLAGRQEADWKDTRLKTGIFLLPLTVLLSAHFSPRQWRLLLQCYCLLLVAALLFCLTKAVITYTQHNDSTVFFYHQLVKPIKQHAVFFSIFVFIAIVFLLEKMRWGRLLFPRNSNWLLVLFFVLSIVLLSSKLVLTLLLVTLGYYAIHLTRQDRLRRKIVLMLMGFMLLFIAVVIITRNPVGRRFQSELSDPSLATREVFNPGIYFTGVQLRLLQWKLVPAILNEDNSWWTGVGSKRGQALLDSQYISRNMYVGTPERGDKGFLGFNTHNQFLESLLRTGIAGGIAFLLFALSLAGIGWEKRRTGYIFVFLLLLLYCFIESVFETQYGQVLSVFFPVFLAMEE